MEAEVASLAHVIPCRDEPTEGQRAAALPMLLPADWVALTALAVSWPAPRIVLAQPPKATTERATTPMLRMDLTDIGGSFPVGSRPDGLSQRRAERAFGSIPTKKNARKTGFQASYGQTLKGDPGMTEAASGGFRRQAAARGACLRDTKRLEDESGATAKGWKPAGD